MSSLFQLTSRSTLLLRTSQTNNIITSNIIKFSTKISLAKPHLYYFSTTRNTTKNNKMKIAITGARGTVGREVVKACAQAGHSIVEIDRTDQEPDKEFPNNTEMRTADAANDYDALLKAFKGCDAVIHLAAVPNPVDKPDHFVHQNNICAAFNGMRAAAELGIHRFCYASSVNAIGLVWFKGKMVTSISPCVDNENGLNSPKFWS